jgi:hypothetical protein
MLHVARDRHHVAIDELTDRFGDESLLVAETEGV